jgi:hypothetical protein
MSDIVTRLRMRPTIVCRDQFGSFETDRVATKLFDDVHALMREAADEIDRLRADLAQRRLERDEARRELCHYKCRSIMDECPDANTAPQLIARNRGWDCFEKKAKP